MWPSWDVNGSGKNQMFSFYLRGICALLQQGGGGLTCQDTGPGLWVLRERSRTRKLRFRETSSYNALHEGKAARTCALHTALASQLNSINIRCVTDAVKDRPMVALGLSASQQIPTPRNLKVRQVTPLPSDLMCVRIVWWIHVRPGSRGLAVLLRLTSTRLFLAEDLLTAHLTFVICAWETANSCWQPKKTHRAPFPYTWYRIDTSHLMRTSTKFFEKSLHGEDKNIIKKRLISSQLVETSSSFGEALGGVGVWGCGGSGCL